MNLREEIGYGFKIEKILRQPYKAYKFHISFANLIWNLYALNG